jgi:CheY-like chemotaxis protein
VLKLISRRDEPETVVLPIAEVEAKDKRLQVVSQLLDNVPINAMTCRLDDFTIDYANKATLENIKTIEHLLPVTSDTLVGACIDVFHKAPSHQRQLLRNPANLPHKATIKIGEETMVLLVEDEEDVRTTTKLLLEARGFSVVEAANGPAALRVLESGVHIDILFSDVVMPGGMTGTVLASHAYRLFPALPVILTSGYADDEILNDPSVPESVQVLAKPYDPHALIALFDQINKEQA